MKTANEAQIIDEIETEIIPGNHLEYDENTYNHGYNNALDDVLKIIKKYKKGNYVKQYWH